MSGLYERIGGEEALAKAVDIFYDRILADDHISGFFDSVDMDRQKRKQRQFLMMAMGGPPRYTGKNMKDGHAHLVERGLDDSHVDSVAGHLSATLDSLGVDPDDRDMVMEKVEGLRDDVLGRRPVTR